MFESEVGKIMDSPWSYPGLVIRDKETLVLTFSVNDSIRLWSCWSVFMSDMKFFLRRIEWPKSVDRFPISAAGPTTFGTEGIVPKALAEGLIDSAMNVVRENSSISGTSLTIDGVYCSIAIWRNGDNAKINWVQSRSGNSSVDSWLASSVSLVSKLLPDSSAKMVQGIL